MSSSKKKLSFGTRLNFVERFFKVFLSKHQKIIKIYLPLSAFFSGLQHLNKKEFYKYPVDNKSILLQIHLNN